MSPLSFDLSGVAKDSRERACLPKTPMEYLRKPAGLNNSDDFLFTLANILEGQLAFQLIKPDWDSHGTPF